MRDIATQTNTSALTWQLTPAARKAVMVLHAICGISWMGVDIAVFVLLMTARTTNDPALVISGFNAIRMVVPVAVPPLGLGILLTGWSWAWARAGGWRATGGCW
jgi:hypothetical protein